MPMTYPYVAIPDAQVPRASAPVFQHQLDTYASETNKVISVWREFADADLAFRPHPRSASVRDIFKHQLLSERRFFGEFLGLPEPPAAEVAPRGETTRDYADHVRELALPRLGRLAEKQDEWWLEVVPFFDVRRARLDILASRLAHGAPPHATDSLFAPARKERALNLWPDG